MDYDISCFTDTSHLTVPTFLFCKHGYEQNYLIGVLCATRKQKHNVWNMASILEIFNYHILRLLGMSGSVQNI